MSGPESTLWPGLFDPALRGQDDLCAVSAQGTRITFADGRTRLCGTSGLWNVNLGYGNEAIATAVAEALRDASYLSCFRYENVYARRASDELVELAGAGHFRRVAFTTSGGSANDLTMKIARHYEELRSSRPRKVVVSLQGSYHGLTFGGYALTGEDLGQRVNGVDQRLVRHVPPNDPEALATLLSRQGSQIAAMVIEPVLGSGAIPLTDEYIAEVLRLRDQYGFLLVADEVATGFGRTGRWFASQAWPSPPDLMIVSKGLSNGTAAVAAVLVSEPVAAAFERAGVFPVHAETQAGTPPSCAAVSATIEQMHALDAVASATRLSKSLDEALDRFVAEHSLVTATTGVGCFRSLRMRTPDGEPLAQTEVPDLVAAIRQEGAIVHPGLQGIQLVPALTYTEQEVAELLHCVDRGMERYFAQADRSQETS